MYIEDSYLHCKIKNGGAFNKSVTFVGILIPKGINNFNTVPNME